MCSFDSARHLPCRTGIYSPRTGQKSRGRPDSDEFTILCPGRYGKYRRLKRIGEQSRTPHQVLNYPTRTTAPRLFFAGSVSVSTCTAVVDLTGNLQLVWNRSPYSRGRAVDANSEAEPELCPRTWILRRSSTFPLSVPARRRQQRGLVLALEVPNCALGLPSRYRRSVPGGQRGILAVLFILSRYPKISA